MSRRCEMSKRIVIVEKEPDLLEILTYNLEREGFEVIGCDRSESGLKAILRESPDMAILDVVQPNVHELSLYRQIRDNETTHKTHMIMMTPKGEQNDQEFGVKYGLVGDDYISMPFSIRELVARVKEHRLENNYP